MQITITIPDTFTAQVRGQDFPVDFAKFPEASLTKVFLYGGQRIFNDASASAKDGAEAISLATKRRDNLEAGIIRAAGLRVGDPVKRRALELAETAIKANPAWVAFLQKNGLKAGAKEALAALRKKAEAFVAVEGNQFTAQAKVDVEAAKGLNVEELEIEL